MLELTKEIEVVKQKGIDFKRLIIEKTSQGKIAVLEFSILNEKEEEINTVGIKYDIVAFNKFWEDFNTGTFLYKEIMMKINGAGDFEIPNLEGDFKNAIDNRPASE
jgi:hypothetical protein